MQGYKTQLYLITAQTNLHVGSGDTEYGIIDRLVQRDPLTGYPFISGSSLKGALRQFFDHVWKKNEQVQIIFGRDKGDDGKNTAGKFSFFDAYLLSLPVRSDKIAYFNVTSPALLNGLIETAAMLDSTITQKAEIENVIKALTNGTKAVHFVAGVEKATLENTEIVANKGEKNQALESLLGENLAIVTNNIAVTNGFPNDLFGVLCDDFHLPVMARNNLENGQSQNLWYEQVLPRQTRFFCSVLYPANEQDVFDEFHKLLIDAKTVVQIGANASIGYGRCQFQPL
jgi:CRISPR-associated protein Cmr4